MTEWTLEELKEKLRGRARAILQFRHAERPKMDPDDPTFGDALSLTEEGVRTARKLGTFLSAYRGEATFLSSPLKRTRMTAALIAEGMGYKPLPPIPADELLGNGSFYYDDPAQVLEVFRPENFFRACFEYFQTGEQKGFKNLYSATEALEAWLKARLERKVLIVATHDCYIAAYLAAKNRSWVFSRENWPRFLDGGVTLFHDDGRVEYALLRTGLSAGICGVTCES